MLEHQAMSRRNFLIGATGVAALSVGGAALAGCTNEKLADSGDGNSEPSNAKSVPDEFTDGTYVTEAVSMHGKVAVSTVIQDGAIAEVKVLNHRESYVLGECAVERIPQLIADSQCVDVNAVTGATVTSMAIQSAVEEAIYNAGGDAKDFMGYEPPTPTPSKKDITVDVAVVGAGPAGLMAAWELADQGKKVMIFEKMPFAGGCTPLTGGGIYTAETKLQQQWGYDDCVERYSTFDKCVEFRQGQAETDSPYYNPEMPYLTNTILYSSKAVDKMFDIGVGFTPLDRALAPVFAPGDFQVGCKYSMVFVEHYLTHKLGVEIVKEAPVTSLVQDGSKVVGFIAEGADGTTYTVSADAVVLASGGYIMNDDLMQEYQADELKFPIMGPPWTTGDGLLMAKDAGAAWVCMDQGVTSHYHGGVSLAEISYICNTVTGVLVDATGKRCVNESGDYKRYLPTLKEKEKTDFYWVFDLPASYGLKPNGNTYGIDYQFLAETGDLIEGENVQDLAEKYELPDLVATLEAVNECAINGAVDEFENEKLPAMDLQNKMFAVKVLPTPYIAQGGVHVDLEGRVLGEDGAAIEGLYAAGDVTGAVDNLDGHPYNIGLSQAFGWGQLVGETIARELA